MYLEVLATGRLGASFLGFPHSSKQTLRGDYLSGCWPVLLMQPSRLKLTKIKSVADA